MYLSVSLSLSISLYIYIYVYVHMHMYCCCRTGGVAQIGEMAQQPHGRSRTRYLNTQDIAIVIAITVIRTILIIIVTLVVMIYSYITIIATTPRKEQDALGDGSIS